MNTQTSGLVLVLASMVAAPVLAVKNGSNVPASEYKDYVVNLTINGDTSCGGALIGSDYLLSARHCFTDDHTVSGTLPSSGQVSIGQGIRSELKKTDVNYTVHVDGSNILIVNDWVTDAQNWFDTVVYPADSSMNGRTFSSTDVEGDWVIVKLSSSIPHSDSAQIVPLYDTTSLTSYLPANTTVTFRGWGLTENGSTPSVMQKYNLRVTTDWEKGVERVYSNTSSLFDADANQYVETVCTTSDPSGIICEFDGTDILTTYGFGDSSTAEGDSGTPLVYNDNIVGLIHGSNQSADVGYVQHFTLAMDYIKSSINELVYPDATRYVAYGSTATQQFNVVVTNYTASSRLLVPTLNDSTGLFSADVSACNTSLASGESCTIIVTFNAGGSSITSEKNASIDLGSGDIILLSGAIATSDDSTDSSNGGGSGGSIGVFGLLVLAMYGWIRNKRT